MQYARLVYVLPKFGVVRSLNSANYRGYKIAPKTTGKICWIINRFARFC